MVRRQRPRSLRPIKQKLLVIAPEFICQLWHHLLLLCIYSCRTVHAGLILNACANDETLLLLSMSSSEPCWTRTCSMMTVSCMRRLQSCWGSAQPHPPLSCWPTGTKAGLRISTTAPDRYECLQVPGCSKKKRKKKREHGLYFCRIKASDSWYPSRQGHCTQ